MRPLSSILFSGPPLKWAQGKATTHCLVRLLATGWTAPNPLCDGESNQPPHHICPFVPILPSGATQLKYLSSSIWQIKRHKELPQSCPRAFLHHGGVKSLSLGIDKGIVNVLLKKKKKNTHVSHFSFCLVLGRNMSSFHVIRVFSSEVKS